MSDHRRALTAAHVAAMLFGLTGIFGALIHADASAVTCGRAAFACIALALFARFQQRSLLRGLTRRQLGILLLSGVVLALHWVTFFIAVKIGGVAIATLGFASFPAFIALFDVLVFGERIGARDTALLALVSGGLILVTPAFNLGDQGTLGLLWAVASGFSFALLATINRRAGGAMDAIQVAFWQNAVVALVMLPFGWSSLWQMAWADWTYLALLGVFCTGLAQVLFVSSLRQLDARRAALIIALEPVYAIACAWWLFGQQPMPHMLAGALLIMAAIVLSGVAGTRKAGNGNRHPA